MNNQLQTREHYTVTASSYIYSSLIEDLYSSHIEYWYNSNELKIRFYHELGITFINYAASNNISKYSPLIDEFLDFCEQREIQGYDKKKIYRIIQFADWMPILDFDKFQEGKTVSWYKIDRYYLPKLNITSEQEKALEKVSNPLTNPEIIEPIKDIDPIIKALPIVRKVLRNSEVYRHMNFTDEERETLFKLDEIIQGADGKRIQCKHCGKEI